MENVSVMYSKLTRWKNSRSSERRRRNRSVRESRRQEGGREKKNEEAVDRAAVRAVPSLPTKSFCFRRGQSLGGRNWPWPRRF